MEGKKLMGCLLWTERKHGEREREIGWLGPERDLSPTHNEGPLIRVYGSTKKIRVYVLKLFSKYFLYWMICEANFWDVHERSENIGST
jgi:hypothetical protein